ncbi:DUF2141 domain-containing protein [Sphingomonas qomolangmaensis]|uniref:DUF2141 domain-containing protein n=1 Tax=Sphingomonas qomolangmaensis TaxID=2918765 RepID=A0ABY5L8N1_9SPHN|nr:DUF2141 domain-containing protein [Sphingomonas qomolangmaensis]UUL82506.1 DUF2141 domain-containing protein [Sphingomonas qomolangmaensis]
MKHSILKMVAAMAFAATTAPAEAGVPPLGTDVIVTVRGVAKAEGGLYVNLCRKPEFLTPKCYKALGRKVSKTGSYVVDFKDVEPGTYAVLAIHDVNGNRTLDRNGYGAPTEPSGVSGSGLVVGQLPEFDRSSFKVDTSIVHISLDLS